MFALKDFFTNSKRKKPLEPDPGGSSDQSHHVYKKRLSFTPPRKKLIKRAKAGLTTPGLRNRLLKKRKPPHSPTKKEKSEESKLEPHDSSSQTKPTIVHCLNYTPSQNGNYIFPNELDSVSSFRKPYKKTAYSDIGCKCKECIKTYGVKILQIPERHRPECPLTEYLDIDTPPGGSPLTDVLPTQLYLRLRAHSLPPPTHSLLSETVRRNSECTHRVHISDNVKRDIALSIPVCSKWDIGGDDSLKRSSHIGSEVFKIPLYYNREPRHVSAPAGLDTDPPSPAPPDPPSARNNDRFMRRSRYDSFLESLLKDNNEFDLQSPEPQEPCRLAAPRWRMDQDHHRNSNYRSQSDRPRHWNTELSMDAADDADRKVVIEFCHLLEKSKQLFNGLRDLPQCGYKHWHSYFGRTFDVYSKLWKFQQQNRAVLDNKYGLKRWQIGEIASKIGQLYYHYYLRSSDLSYLFEAFSFYYAIRGRKYYTQANKAERCDLMVKKLRYYARFIVVCLLLNKVNLIRDLIKELEGQIEQYGTTYDPDDLAEWRLVVEEAKTFIQAEPAVHIQHPDDYSLILTNRLGPNTSPPMERNVQMTLFLQDAIIVGGAYQVKFSELTLDMLRLLQTLEKESGAHPQFNESIDEPPRIRFISTPNMRPGPGNENGMSGGNPKKYLLFKPSPSQLLAYLGNCSLDLHPNAALLLYISADGLRRLSHNTNAANGETCGIVTADNVVETTPTERGTASKDARCLYPVDLGPFTRKPLFMIIDSDTSHVFLNTPKQFDQPLVILMSPEELPANLQERRHHGNLFSLFLNSPLSALNLACDTVSVPLQCWDRSQPLLDAFMAETIKLLNRPGLDTSFMAFMGDDFLRLLFLRYIFCDATLRLHKDFQGARFRPKCMPRLPDDLFEHPNLVRFVLDIAHKLKVRSYFVDSSGAGPSSGN